jgi:transposase
LLPCQKNKDHLFFHLSSFLFLFYHSLFFLIPSSTKHDATKKNIPKRKNTPILPVKVIDAIQLLIQGQSARQVAKTLGISIGSVLNIRKKNKENIPPPTIGRPNKVSPRTKEVLARQFKTGMMSISRDGQRYIQETDGVQVHLQTVRRNLRESGLKAYVQQKRPDLRPNHVQDRLAFAREHINWTVDDWKRVMFSDESMFSRVGSFGRKYYYSDHEHKRLLPNQVQSTPQAGGGKMMVWGCITFSGKGDLCRFHGTLDSDLYLKCLKDYILGSFVWFGMDPATSIFQQDNSRVHTANIVQEWFVQQEFTVLRWPPNSPDLNIIEHVWRYMKQRLARYKNAPDDLNELWERVQDVWDAVPLQFLQNLYESMPKRMRALLQNKGGQINY